MREEFKLNHLCCLWLLYHDSEMAEVNISLSVSLETYSSYRNGANMGTMLTSYCIQVSVFAFATLFGLMQSELFLLFVLQDLCSSSRK